jgi:hypothetical protein
MIVNQHQDRAFRFSACQLDTLDNALAVRAQILSDLLPWPDPDYGTDESWVRLFPYEQAVRADTPFRLDAQFTNHGPHPVSVQVEPVLPAGWDLCSGDRGISMTVPSRTAGTVSTESDRPDGVARMHLVALDARPGQYVLPVRVTWDGTYLGQFRHAIVQVEA